MASVCGLAAAHHLKLQIVFADLYGSRTTVEVVGDDPAGKAPPISSLPWWMSEGSLAVAEVEAGQVEDIGTDVLKLGLDM